MRRLLFPLLLSAAALLSACDTERAARLEEGVSTEADVRRQFGEPVQLTERADGSKLLAYPRQPEGWTNYEAEIGADGKLAALRQLLTEANFAKVRDGMPSDEVLRMLGRPADKAGEYMNRQTWSWRYPTYECLWARITFEPDGKVRGGASLMTDPRCDVDH